MTLQEKLTELEAQFKRLADNANAVSGAIQFCKSLIEEEQQAMAKTPEPEPVDFRKMISDAKE